MISETLGRHTFVGLGVTLVISSRAFLISDTSPASLGVGCQHNPILTWVLAIIPVAKMGSRTQGGFALRGIRMRIVGVLSFLFFMSIHC